MRIPKGVLALAVVVLVAVGAAVGAGVGVMVTRGSDAPQPAQSVQQPGSSPLCQDALARRQRALDALNQPFQVAGGREAGYDPNADPARNSPWREAERQRDQADADIRQHCR